MKSNTFRVGPWTVIVTAKQIAPKVFEAQCEWDPDVPNRKFTESEAQEYRKGLDEAANALDIRAG